MQPLRFFAQQIRWFDRHDGIPSLSERGRIASGSSANIEN